MGRDLTGCLSLYPWCREGGDHPGWQPGGAAKCSDNGKIGAIKAQIDLITAKHGRDNGKNGPDKGKNGGYKGHITTFITIIL